MWWCSVFEHVTDHATRALALLPDQFQKDGIRALLSSWTPEFQEIEDALWVLFEATLDTATGARLDQYAVLLGEPRQTLSNTALRKVIRARILANRSQGATPTFARCCSSSRGPSPCRTTSPRRSL